MSDDVDRLQEVRIPYGERIVQFSLSVFFFFNGPFNDQQIRQTYIAKFISANRIRFIFENQRRIIRLVEPCDVVSRFRDIVRHQSGTVNHTSVNDTHLRRRYIYRLFSVQFDDNKITNLRYAFEECNDKAATTSFVCMSSRGEKVCSELKSMGFNALNVSWDGTLSQSKNTAKILPSLDTLLQKSHTTESCSFVCSEKKNTSSESNYMLLKYSMNCRVAVFSVFTCLRTKRFLNIISNRHGVNGKRKTNVFSGSQQMDDVIAKFFPDSIDELYLLNDKLTTDEPVFVEVPTRSPRYSEQKSTTPVFVIPGFKPKLVETFYRRFFYPVFEARLPQNIGSVDALSEVLVNVS